MSDPTPTCAAAGRVVQRIESEHLLLARIIAAMQAWVVQGREPGANVDHALFEAMLRYVQEVPDRVHHPQEDRHLFPAAAAIPEARAVIDELEREHAAGAQMLAALRRAHGALRAGEPNALNGLCGAVDEFAEFYWAHMRKEERALLPLAVSGLTTDQWDAIDAAFTAVNDPLFGCALAQEYRLLHRFITSRMTGPLKAYVQGAVREAP